MSGDLIWALVRLLVALPLILGIAYLVLKYGLARRYMVATGNHRMKLVEQLPLGPKTTLSLVALEGKYYLLAHQDNSISLVKELGELKEQEEIIGDIVDFTPQTLDEYDRFQRPPVPGTEGYLPGIIQEKCRRHLSKLTGWLVGVNKDLLAKRTARKRPGG